jgi:D-alanine-D-alanine ligase
MAKRVFRDMGIPTPDFAEINDIQDIDNISLQYPLFAKPLAEGTGKGIDSTSKIHNIEELTTVCSRLLKTYRQSVLLETYLPGREFTVGVVGTGNKARSVGVMEVILKKNAELHAYSYVNKEQCEELVEYRPVDDDMAKQAEEITLAAWRGLGCRDAGRVDLRADVQGVPNVIEINPLAGIHPEHSDLPIICTFYGISYISLLEMILESTLDRVNHKEKYNAIFDRK